MVPKSFLICLLFAVVLNPINLPAQNSGCTRHTVAVGVVDHEWNFVQGLTAANFRGSVHGRDVQILSIAVDTSPRHIVLLVDSSGSMAGVGWKAAKSISEYLIRFAPPQASLAQICFSDTVRYTAGFDQDRLEMMKSLTDLVKVCEALRGRTALFDAVSNGLTRVGPLGFGDAIFVVTDAGDNASRTEPQKVEKDLLTEGVRLFGVVITPDPLLRGREIMSDSPGQFHSTAEATGGNMLTMRNGSVSNPYIKGRTRGDALDLALQRLYQQMGQFYRLELSLPQTVDKPTKWKLEVTDANGKLMGGVEVHYPQELMPCANASS